MQSLVKHVKLALISFIKVAWINMKKEKTSGFAKMTKIVVWVMLIAMLGGVVMTAISALNLF
ncbi:hypothetical protein FC24_GL001814 [Loigolactobacillus rennini DSM 20253]|uniref:DUF4044 domain-containing protein n=2 Tax=Loigolactobacillus rennini TaxID=238013 RepID=A0A0R2CZJ5_9LACO|nr:hypothetical protein FC24_GL001814 [Loigolactobacillus rennini DSM 20253]